MGLVQVYGERACLLDTRRRGKLGRHNLHNIKYDKVNNSEYQIIHIIVYNEGKLS